MRGCVKPMVIESIASMRRSVDALIRLRPFGSFRSLRLSIISSRLKAQRGVSGSNRENTFFLAPPYNWERIITYRH